MADASSLTCSLRRIAGAIGLLGAAACASVEPAPCTAEWIDWKKDEVIRAFVIDHRGDVGFVRDLAGSFGDGASTPQTLLRLTSAIPRVARLVEDFTELAVPAVETAVAQCGSAPRAASLFADMLREEGVDEETLEWIEALGLLMDRSARAGAG